MTHDPDYACLYEKEGFVAVLLAACVPILFFAVIIAITDYLRKNLANNPAKIAFYSVLFLQVPCRIINVLYVFIEHSTILLYFDLPTLLLLALVSVVIVQVDKVFPTNVGTRRRRFTLVLCNIIACVTGFACYVLSNKLKDYQTFEMMAYLESVAFFAINIVLFWSFRCHWMSGKFVAEKKLGVIYLCCAGCILVRAGIRFAGIHAGYSPHEKLVTSGTEDDQSMIPGFFYFGIGEAAICYFSLYIQYLVTGVAQSSESVTVPLLGNLEKGKAKASEVVIDLYKLSDGSASSIIQQQESSELQHHAQVIKFLNLFEKSLNATNVVLHEVLGKGGSGAIVYRCTLREGPFAGGTFAVKVMKDCVPADFEALMNEVRIYQSLRHAHIVRFMGTDLASPRRELRLFMEYIPHTLDVHIKKRAAFRMQYFSVPQICKYMLQLVSGLQALHERNVIHRDLKTSNIFVALSGVGDISDLKIGDFDVSTFLKRAGVDGAKNRSNYLTANKGTDSFRAPEMVSETLNKVKYGAKVDIWSMGMVLYSFLTLKEPYENENRFEIGWDAPPALPSEITSNAKLTALIHIFERCASANPSDRPSCNDISLLLQNTLVASTKV